MKFLFDLKWGEVRKSPKVRIPIAIGTESPEAALGDG